MIGKNKWEAIAMLINEVIYLQLIYKVSYFSERMLQSPRQRSR